MGAAGGIVIMNEKNRFALVPRPPSAVEKAEPGAKRILSGMVADTIALIPARVHAETEGWVEKGNRYFDSATRDDNSNSKSDYIEAVEWYRKAAERNHAKAQCFLGHCYASGWGVTEDEVEAVKWFQKSAESGYADSQRWLGDFYEHTQDYLSAFKWYRKGAEQGDFSCQQMLGDFYYDGKGVPKDNIEAANWYRKAAEQGLVTAQSSLAWLNCDSNKIEHVKWLRKAAEQGDEKAQIRLSIILFAGGYLPEEQQDIVEAYKWMRIRAEKEFDGIIHSNIKEFMTPEQIQKGEALAHEYLSKAMRQQNN